jgi:hypothetical protein
MSRGGWERRPCTEFPHERAQNPVCRMLPRLAQASTGGIVLWSIDAHAAGLRRLLLYSPIVGSNTAKYGPQVCAHPIGSNRSAIISRANICDRTRGIVHAQRLGGHVDE